MLETVKVFQTGVQICWSWILSTNSSEDFGDNLNELSNTSRSYGRKKFGKVKENFRKVLQVD